MAKSKVPIAGYPIGTLFNAEVNTDGDVVTLVLNQDRNITIAVPAAQVTLIEN
jgi:hypothetical protein